MKLFKRSTTSAPYEPRRVGPIHPGSYLFALRSTPRHHDGIKACIESTGKARVYFSEPLAYLRGQGVAIFRVEAFGFDWLENLYTFWRDTEALEAFEFDVALYVNNTQYITTLRGHSAQEMQAIIEDAAPRTPDDPKLMWKTPITHK